MSATLSTSTSATSSATLSTSITISWCHLITNCQGLLYIGIINIIELVSSSARVRSAFSVTYRQGHLGPVKNGGKLLVEKLWWNFFGGNVCIYLLMEWWNISLIHCDNNNNCFSSISAQSTQRCWRATIVCYVFWDELSEYIKVTNYN